MDQEDAGAVSQVLSESGDLEREWIELDYSKIFHSVDILRERIKSKGIDMIVFGRNDQVHPRARIGRIVRQLGVGYSSISPLDGLSPVQLGQLARDLVAGTRVEKRYAPATLDSSDKKQSFSLIFDVEQLGGVRFGLPRILALLEDLELRATFFVTNMMLDRYQGLRDMIKGAGHEIGIHGLWHEFFTGYGKEQQIKSVNEMKKQMDLGGTWGANLMGRMDHTTVEALASSGCAYFLIPFHHFATPLGMIECPPLPMRFCTESGYIWAIPTSMETYNKPHFVIPALTRFCIESARRYGSNHFCMLMHPFRDGSLRHLDATSNLLERMKLKTDIKCRTLGEYVGDLAPIPGGKKRLRMLYRMPSYGHDFSAQPVGLLGQVSLLYDLAFSRIHQALSERWTIEIGFEPNPDVPNVVVGRHRFVEEAKVNKIDSVEKGKVVALDWGVLRNIGLPTSLRYFQTSLGLSFIQLLSSLDKQRTDF